MTGKDFALLKNEMRVIFHEYNLERISLDQSRDDYSEGLQIIRQNQLVDKYVDKLEERVKFYYRMNK